MSSRPKAVQLVFGELEPAAAAPEPATRYPLYASVAVNRPMRCEYTYGVPASLASGLARGMRVVVPLGRARELGVVVDLSPEPGIDGARIRGVAKVLDQEPSISADLLELTRWISAYYACSWGEALAAALPAALKREKTRRKVTMISAAAGAGAETLTALEHAPQQHRLLRTLIEVAAPVALTALCKRLRIAPVVARALERKGLVLLEAIDRAADPLLATASAERRRPDKLSEDQQRAVLALNARLESREYATFLLQGVTGSGKTEVYLRVIEHALALGRGAIVLVPEIALTPQTVGWFRSRFGEVAVLHSGMTDSQRHDMWLKVDRREARVVVGARSAIFAPVADLGVIVVDEEHEPSFKQGETPRYHGRDVAVMRARNCGAICILGSATPSLESWQNVESGRYQRLMLRGRVGEGRLPKVEIVDLRQERREPGEQGVLFSQRLRQLLQQALEQKQQSILFLNRRGFAPSLWCAACGETVRCRQCDVALAFHRRIRRVVCHSCCEETMPPKACPSCTAPRITYLGAGSEKIEAALSKLLPTARVRRMDSDTMLRREDYESVLESFGRGEIDVLVGTQMIAKGLDFPRVTVVGVISADSSLHFPDFRAAERTFQLLAQVAGRAGRGDLEGRIVIQTTTPEHPAIRFAARHDYEGFARAESSLRAELDYPPYGRLIRVVFEDQDEGRVRDCAASCAELLRAQVAGHPDTSVLGPAEAPIGMLRGRHRHHLLLKGAPGSTGFAAARAALLEFAGTRTRPHVTVDVDPTALL